MYLKNKPLLLTLLVWIVFFSSNLFAQQSIEDINDEICNELLHNGSNAQFNPYYRRRILNLILQSPTCTDKFYPKTCEALLAIGKMNHDLSILQDSLDLINQSPVCSAIHSASCAELLFIAKKRAPNAYQECRVLERILKTPVCPALHSTSCNELLALVNNKKEHPHDRHGALHVINKNPECAALQDERCNTLWDMGTDFSLSIASNKIALEIITKILNALHSTKRLTTVLIPSKRHKNPPAASPHFTVAFFAIPCSIFAL